MEVGGWMMFLFHKVICSFPAVKFSGREKACSVWLSDFFNAVDAFGFAPRAVDVAVRFLEFRFNCIFSINIWMYI